MSERTDQDIRAVPLSIVGAGTDRPPLPPPPPPRRGRRVWLVLTIVASVIVGLTVIGAISDAGSPEGGEIFAEDFESDRIGFSTDSDRTIDLSVEDGVYRIEVKETEAPSLMRHVFAHTYDGVSIEATIVHPQGVEQPAIAAIGCWAGLSAYMFGTSPTGDAYLIETISEATGERRDLLEPLVVEHARPAGQPNRLRLDCVGGGREPTIVSAYVNDEPIASVSVVEGLDSFNAAGFFVASRRGGVVFRADDFTVAAARPGPGTSPVTAL